MAVWPPRYMPLDQTSNSSHGHSDSETNYYETANSTGEKRKSKRADKNLPVNQPPPPKKHFCQDPQITRSPLKQCPRAETLHPPIIRSDTLEIVSLMA